MTAREPESNGDLSESLRRLCAAAIRGDESAFREIHQRLNPGVRRFLLRRIQSNAELVEELGQRVWVATWESFRAGRYDASRAALTTFVYGIAYHVLLQHFRQSRIGFSVEEDDQHVAKRLFALEGEPSEFLRACELLDAIRACLSGRCEMGEITDQDRAILDCVSRGETEREMARRFSISPSTANARKQLALQRLEDFLRRRGHLSDGPEQPADFSE